MKAAPVFLLLEPSSILQSALHKWLQNKLNHDPILIAENGVESLRLAAQETPTHFLVEINLPDKTVSYSTESSARAQMDMSSGINCQAD